MRTTAHAVAAVLAISAVATPATSFADEEEGAVTETRDVGSFDRIRLAMSADVHVKVGGPVRVSVTAHPDALEHVKTSVRSGALHIDTDRKLGPRGRVRVDVSVPELRQVGVDGSGNVEVDGGRGDCAISVDGSGDVQWRGDGGRISVGIGGSGTVALHGTARALEVKLQGSGDVEAAELRARDVDVEIEGSGDVEVHLDGGRLRAEVNGSGDVRWAGSGSVERAVVSGSGEIRKL